MIRSLVLLIGAVFFVVKGFGQELHTILRPGDLIFQDISCGKMCDAIKEVTQGYGGKDYSHVAMVITGGKGASVIEAVGAGVKETSLDSFLAKTKKPVLVGRVKQAYSPLTSAAIAFSRKQVGVPYDGDFLYDNGKYYCSELVYDAYLYANDGKPFFTLQPMTYKQPGSGAYYPVWVTYFQNKGQDIPEGLPGCNPGGLSLSDKLDIIGEW